MVRLCFFERPGNGGHRDLPGLCSALWNPKSALPSRSQSSPAVPSPASSLEDSKRGGRGRKREEEPKGKGDRGEVRSALLNWVREDGFLRPQEGPRPQRV